MRKHSTNEVSRRSFLGGISAVGAAQLLHGCMSAGYLAIYRAGKNPLDLAKARALGDALVRIQRPNGYIPTEYAKVENRDDPMQGWLNCSCAALSAMAELAAAVGE